jgi:hypothetical protein
MSAQGTKPFLEVECCDSCFDENPTSSGSVDGYTLQGYTHKSCSKTAFTYSGLCQCMPALDERRFAATSLNPLYRMRMFPLGVPNEALPPLTMLLASGGARV